MTPTQLQNALAKLGGEHFAYQLSRGVYLSISPGRRYESEQFTCALTIYTDLRHEHKLVQVTVTADDSRSLIAKLQAAIRDGLAEQARRRKLTQQAPQRALPAPMRRLEHHPS